MLPGQLHLHQSEKLPTRAIGGKKKKKSHPDQSAWIVRPIRAGFFGEVPACYSLAAWGTEGYITRVEAPIASGFRALFFTHAEGTRWVGAYRLYLRRGDKGSDNAPASRGFFFLGNKSFHK